MAGRKVFTSGEILTAADVNSFLMNQVVAVFADSTARSSAIPTPSEGMVTYRKDANRVEVYDGSAFGPIGKILQVVSTQKTDTFTTNSTSFTAITGLSATITPLSATNKVLVLVQVSASMTTTGFNSFFRLMEGAYHRNVGDAAGSRLRASGSLYLQNVNDVRSLGFSSLESPATTSAVTYSVEASSQTSSHSVCVNRNGNDNDNTSTARYASNITLLEVAV